MEEKRFKSIREYKNSMKIYKKKFLLEILFFIGWLCANETDIMIKKSPGMPRLCIVVYVLPTTNSSRAAQIVSH